MFFPAVHAIQICAPFRSAWLVVRLLVGYAGRWICTYMHT